MKLGVVTQWGRAKAQVPPDERLARRSVVTSTCPPSNGSTELEGARMPAARWRPEKSIVVDNRIALKAVPRGTPTVSSGRTAAVLGAPGRVRRTPPGSQSGACMHKGSSGTWESHRSPCRNPGVGDRATKSPGVVGELPPEYEPGWDTTNGRKQTRYRGASDQRSVPRGAVWQSERRRVPEKGGNSGPRDPREGRRRRASR
jgi:hypothetical protein